MHLYIYTHISSDHPSAVGRRSSSARNAVPSGTAARVDRTGGDAAAAAARRTRVQRRRARTRIAAFCVAMTVVKTRSSQRTGRHRTSSFHFARAVVRCSRFPRVDDWTARIRPDYKIASIPRASMSSQYILGYHYVSCGRLSSPCTPRRTRCPLRGMHHAVAHVHRRGLCGTLAHTGRGMRFLRRPRGRCREDEEPGARPCV